MKEVERAAHALVRRTVRAERRGFTVSALREHGPVDFTFARKSSVLRVQLKSSSAPSRVGFVSWARTFWEYAPSADVLLFVLFDLRNKLAPNFYLFDLRKKTAPKCLRGKSAIRTTVKNFKSDFHNYKVTRTISSALLELL